MTPLLASDCGRACLRAALAGDGPHDRVLAVADAVLGEGRAPSVEAAAVEPLAARCAAALAAKDLLAALGFARLLRAAALARVPWADLRARVSLRVPDLVERGRKDEVLTLLLAAVRAGFPPPGLPSRDDARWRPGLLEGISRRLDDRAHARGATQPSPDEDWSELILRAKVRAPTLDTQHPTDRDRLEYRQDAAVARAVAKDPLTPTAIRPWAREIAFEHLLYGLQEYAAALAELRAALEEHHPRPERCWQFLSDLGGHIGTPLAERITLGERAVAAGDDRAARIARAATDPDALLAGRPPDAPLDGVNGLGDTSELLHTPRLHLVILLLDGHRYAEAHRRVDEVERLGAPRLVVLAVRGEVLLVEGKTAEGLEAIRAAWRERLAEPGPKAHALTQADLELQRVVTRLEASGHNEAAAHVRQELDALHRTR